MCIRDSYLSAAKRFFNCLGATTALLNPDSWEGFAWGASHHYGGSARNGGCEIYSTAVSYTHLIERYKFQPEAKA